jgi:DNA-directed RNA polymerase subunit RPC12/RpoP
LFFFGYGYGGSEINPPRKYECPHCYTTGNSRIFIKYRYEFIYLFRWVTHKKYTHFCCNCKEIFEISPKEIESELKKHPIPFLTRYGWVFLAGIAASIIITGHILK